MKIIIGAGEKTQEGWISTEQGQLDVLKDEDFKKIAKDNCIEALLAEHVFEHLSIKDIPTALKNCYEHLSCGGYLRIAVPDGFHPNPAYIDYVKPGGTGAGADSHQILFDYLLLTKLLKQAGFAPALLEWWDIRGKFHVNLWNEIDGRIERCYANDPRNKDGRPNYTSLIMDAYKNPKRLGLEKALAFVEKNDIYKLSPFNRKKTSSFYEIARIAPSGGVIIEVGSYHGIGTAALWYGSEDGNKNRVIAIDPYLENFGWIGERYGPEDQLIWEKNMREAEIYPELIKGYSHELSQTWQLPLSLVMIDIPVKNSYPEAAMDWERHVIGGGMIAFRDIDDMSMGTDKAIRNLRATGRWGKHSNWDGFITSIEKIK